MYRWSNKDEIDGWAQSLTGVLSLRPNQLLSCYLACSQLNFGSYNITFFNGRATADISPTEFGSSKKRT